MVRAISAPETLGRTRAIPAVALWAQAGNSPPAAAPPPRAEAPRRNRRRSKSFIGERPETKGRYIGLTPGPGRRPHIFGALRGIPRPERISGRSTGDDHDLSPIRHAVSHSRRVA